MTSWVYRPNDPRSNENGMLEAWRAAPRVIKHGDAPYVIGDEMPPTRHMGTGEHFTSKAAFRQRTRDIGCVEIGNEVAHCLKPRKPVKLSRERRRNDIRRAISELR